MSNQISMIDAAYEIVEKNGVISFNDLVEQVRIKCGMTEEEMMEKISKLYTNLSLDSRFVNLSLNKWDLSIRHDFNTVHEEVKDLDAEGEDKVLDLVDEEEQEDEDLEETSSETTDEDNNDNFLVSNTEGE